MESAAPMVILSIGSAFLKISIFSSLQLVTNAVNYGTMISILLMFGQQFSGMNAIMFYGVNIFEVAHTNLNSFVENIIMAIVQVFQTRSYKFFLNF